MLMLARSAHSKAARRKGLHHILLQNGQTMHSKEAAKWNMKKKYNERKWLQTSTLGFGSVSNGLKK